MIALVIPARRDPWTVEIESWAQQDVAAQLGRPAMLTSRDFHLPGGRGLARMFYDSSSMLRGVRQEPNDGAMALAGRYLAAGRRIYGPVLILRTVPGRGGARRPEGLSVQDILALSTVLVLSEVGVLEATQGEG